MLTIQQRKQGRLIGKVAPHTNRKEPVSYTHLDVYKRQLVHSTPEAYFAARSEAAKKAGITEPVVEKDLNYWAVGCYTSQIRIKQKHLSLIHI